ncbi:heme biosynthesis protein HemY [Methyloligella solikamskensis]|uniref:Heme biosynthesis protein HemY n=1 Tax=Methyloligella solikamskensis TaxID=1177756 RepID=A0ABW3J5T7_9HYPH
MIRVLVFIVVIALAALGLAWLADQPGTIELQWFGYQIETTAFVGVLGVVIATVLLIAIWGLFSFLITRPGAIAARMKQRRRRHGFEALTGGLLAIGIGDRAGAEHNAATARRLLPNEPLTALLRAQTAQLKEDRESARRAFEAMLDNPDTELLGLRGLFLEAKRRNDPEAARQFVEQAVERNPNLAWSVNALFDLQTRSGDWEGALGTLAIARKHDHIDAKEALRRRAVLLTAEADELESVEPDQALSLATEAQRLAPDLIPAAEIAGRILASKGETKRAGKVISKTWKLAPHPDLALVYAYADPGAPPKERLKRVKYLTTYNPEGIEAPLAIANAAIEAQEWEEARLCLQPYLDDRPSARICALMARIEAGEFGDRGREREWLARAMRAPRDRAWVADGYISDRWMPVSPVTGEVDAFEWKQPVDAIGKVDESFVIEERPEPMEEPEPVEEPMPAPLPVDDPQEPQASEGPQASEEPEEPHAEILPPEHKAKAPEEVGPMTQPVVTPPPPTEEELRAEEEERQKKETAQPDPDEPAPIVAQWAGEDDGGPTEPPERELPKQGMADANARTSGEAPDYVPSRPPDDPGIGEDEDEESDLERYRRAHIR